MDRPQIGTPRSAAGPARSLGSALLRGSELAVQRADRGAEEDHAADRRDQLRDGEGPEHVDDVPGPGQQQRRGDQGDELAQHGDEEGGKAAAQGLAERDRDDAEARE